MTPIQITQLAHEAGGYDGHQSLPSDWDAGDWIFTPDQLQEFALRIRAAALVEAAVTMHKVKQEAALEPGEPVYRTDQQIVDQTEELAIFLLSWKYGHKPETTTPMRDGIHPKAEDSWQVACRIQEMLTATDVKNAVNEVE